MVIMMMESEEEEDAGEFVSSFCQQNSSTQTAFLTVFA